MIIVTGNGTPNHMETKEHNTVAGAKKWLFGRIAKQTIWAASYNIAMQSDLLTIHMEIADLNVASLVPHDKRAWSVRDEYTGVAICYEIEKEQS